MRAAFVSAKYPRDLPPEESAPDASSAGTLAGGAAESAARGSAESAAGASTGSIAAGPLASLEATLPPTPLRDLLAADGASVYVLSKDGELAKVAEEAAGDYFPISAVRDWTELLRVLRERGHIVLLDADAVPGGLEKGLAEFDKLGASPIVLVAATREQSQKLVDLLAERRIHRLLIKPAAVGITRLLLESAVTRHLQRRELQRREAPPDPPLIEETWTHRAPKRSLWPAWLVATALVSLLLGALLMTGWGRLSFAPLERPASESGASSADASSASPSVDASNAPPSVDASRASTAVAGASPSAGAAAEQSPAAAASPAAATATAATPPPTGAGALPAATSAASPASAAASPASAAASPTPASASARTASAESTARPEPTGRPAQTASAESTARTEPTGRPEQTASAEPTVRPEPTAGAGPRESNAGAEPQAPAVSPTPSSGTTLPPPAAPPPSPSGSAPPRSAAPSELASVLELGRSRLGAGQLIEPQGDSARAYLERAMALAPDDPSVLQLRLDLAAELAASAGAALDRQDLDDAARRADEAFRLGADPQALGTVQAALQAARRSREEAAQAALLAVADKRLGADQLIAPAGASALDALAELQKRNPKFPGLQQRWTAARSAVARRVHEAVAASDWSTAETWTGALARADADPKPAAALRAELEHARLQQQYLATPAPAGELRLIESTPPVYPEAAQRRGLEGWVDLRFIVGTDGVPGDVEVVDAHPRRVFDQAALDAVSRQRYEPFERDGRKYARLANLRISFHFQ